MVRAFLPAALVISVLATGARAQYTWIGPGSTPQGDYLRGVGIAAYGLGVYNERTAVADQINANTLIMLNEYMWNVAKNENLENAAHRAAVRAKHAEDYKKIQDRIQNDPESIDVLDGSALNTKLWELLDPKVSESTSRHANVPLDADIIRRVPFKLAEKGETFSMRRLSLKGKKKWAVAFQDPGFASLCRAYELAVDNALELAIEGKMKESAIADVEKAVENLEDKLRATPQLFELRRQSEASEARAQLDRLRKTARLFMSLPIQRVFGEVDSYHGTTVDDFRLFMRRHNLTFARADSPDERILYFQLYTALLEQRNKVTGSEKAPMK